MINDKEQEKQRQQQENYARAVDRFSEQVNYERISKKNVKKFSRRNFFVTIFFVRY